MKTLYIDCSMGAAGDMLAASLLELHPRPEIFLEQFNALGIPGLWAVAEKKTSCGIVGTYLSMRIHGEVESDAMHDHDAGHGHSHEHAHDHEHDHSHAHANPHDHTHGHTSLASIRDLVAQLALPDYVANNVLAVYDSIAQAESQVHGTSVENIHFHEVGTLDALADVCAVCLLMHELAPERILASPVHVGSGTVACAHGVLPVPAPATALLLQGVPIYGGTIEGELCTPTGAALLTFYVDEFTNMPPMSIERIGYGMGTREFPQANCVRSLLGESYASSSASTGSEVAGEAGGLSDTVSEFICTIDDMAGEAIGFALEELLSTGALDAYTIAANMKNFRPGVELHVLCSPETRAAILACLFKHTSTIGVRELSHQRHVLSRSIVTHETPYGPVHEKISQGFGVRRTKWEYSDIARIAREQGISLAEAKALVRREQ